MPMSVVSLHSSNIFFAFHEYSTLYSDTANTWHAANMQQQSQNPAVWCNTTCEDMEKTVLRSRGKQSDRGTQEGAYSAPQTQRQKENSNTWDKAIYCHYILWASSTCWIKSSMWSSFSTPKKKTSWLPDGIKYLLWSETYHMSVTLAPSHDGGGLYSPWKRKKFC